MAYKFVIFVCLQALLLKEALSAPYIINTGNQNSAAPVSSVPSAIATGTGSQLIAPNYTPNWPATAQAVPIVTEIVPNLQFGEMTVDGEMPVGGMIKISGSFPVFGSVAVDGTVPSRGSGYVDSIIFQNE